MVALFLGDRRREAKEANYEVELTIIVFHEYRALSLRFQSDGELSGHLP